MQKIQNDINTYLVDPTQSNSIDSEDESHNAFATTTTTTTTSNNEKDEDNNNPKKELKKSIKDQYETFSTSFDLQKREPETAMILQQNPDMCKLYLQLGMYICIYFSL